MAIFDKIVLDFVLDNGSQAMSSFLSNRFNKSMMDYEYELNEKAADNAYARQLDFWEKQNAYDDPSSQVRRLQRAGLNPGVLNGNVSNVSNNLSSVSSGGASTPGPRPGKDIDVLSMLVADEQLKNLKANTNLTNEKAEAERLTNMKLAVEANDWDTYWAITLSNAKLQGKQSEATIEKLKAEARKAFEDARQFEEFGDNGGNVYEDDSGLKRSQKLLTDIQQATEKFKQLNIEADTSLKTQQERTEYERELALDLENKLTHAFGPMEHWGNINVMQAQYDKLVAEQGKIEADRFMLNANFQLELLKLEYQNLWVDKNINSHEFQTLMNNVTTLGDSLLKIGSKNKKSK